VIPAIVGNPLFASSPKDGRGFLLHEIASTLIAGTRRDLFTEAVYVSDSRSPYPDCFRREIKALADGTCFEMHITAAFKLSASTFKRTPHQCSGSNFLPRADIRRRDGSGRAVLTWSVYGGFDWSRASGWA